MKRGSILFLRAVILLVGVGVLAGLLWEPQLEGRNANADLATIYFRDPFLAYAYVGSLPFFFGLYQAFTLLGYVGQGQASRQPPSRPCGTSSTVPWPSSGSSSAARPTSSSGSATTAPAASRWASSPASPAS